VIMNSKCPDKIEKVFKIKKTNLTQVYYIDTYDGECKLSSNAPSQDNDYYAAESVISNDTFQKMSVTIE